ncbi:hypothetical protein IAT40_007051 [Kwoniella sp. CBS 6097]
MMVASEREYGDDVARALRKAAWIRSTGQRQNPSKGVKDATPPLPDYIPFSSSPPPPPVMAPEIHVKLSNRFTPALKPKDQALKAQQLSAESYPKEKEGVGSSGVQKIGGSYISLSTTSLPVPPIIATTEGKEEESGQARAERHNRLQQQAAAKRRGLTLEEYLKKKKEDKYKGAHANHKDRAVMGSKKVKKVDTQAVRAKAKAKAVAKADAEREIGLLVNGLAAATSLESRV